jgi:hypothetical protein
VDSTDFPLRSAGILRLLYRFNCVNITSKSGMLRGSPRSGVKSTCSGAFWWPNDTLFFSWVRQVCNARIWESLANWKYVIFRVYGQGRILYNFRLARQEKLLQGLMKEIVRMKAQQRSLDGGVPLYPFSHATLFRKGEGPQPPDDGSTSGAPLAPLPISPSFNERELTSSPLQHPQQQNVLAAHMPIPASAWSISP